MTPLAVELLGSLAACITTLCWVPQALHILRTRETRSISLVSQSAFAVGTSLWFTYGVMIESWPVIVANALTFMLAASIVALKLRYG